MSSSELLHRIWSRCGGQPTASAAETCAAYLALLKKWNARINLTASTSDAALEPLLVESLWCAGLISAGSLHWLDLGTGAGFPALLLKILRPELSLTLIESRFKKVAFLESVVAELQLENVVVHPVRIDAFLASFPKIGPWNRVSWKALRLDSREVELLRQKCAPTTECWLFHGRRWPLKQPVPARVAPIRRLSCPFLDDSHISIFHPSGLCFT